MKQLAYILLLLPFLIFAQVGIGTTNPQKTLHVNGDVRIDSLPHQPDGRIVTANWDGDLGYRLGVVSPYEKYYDANIVYARDPVLVQPSNTNSLHDINLEVDIVIPANFSGHLKIETSVPCGVYDIPFILESYIGTALFKNGVDLEKPNRKFSLEQDRPTPQGGSLIYRIVYVTMKHFEPISNPSSSPIIYNYEVKGYVEHYYPSFATVEYFFNKWFPCIGNCPNYNIGTSSIYYELKSL